MQFKYGDDAPITLLTSALEFAKKLMPDPDSFLYTGDHVVHDDLTDFLAETVETNVKTMARYYATEDNETNLDVTALLGNADTSPDYTMSVTDPEAETNPSIRRYPFQVQPGLVQPPWLSDFAYIVGHIPPIIDSFSGAQMWEPHYIKTYKAIVSQFTDIIKAQFFAHVHSIEFRIPLISEQRAQEEAEGTELVPLFMSAAISPIYNNNPAFIIWDFDANTYEVLDFTVYGTNISSDSQELDWRSLFKASTAYGVNSLRTTELNAFVDRIAADSALLEQYYYNSKAQSYLQSSCVDVACQSKWLCTTQWYTSSEDFEACVKELETQRSS
ncbi:hypothetical protein Pcac1_g20290 [Phytophthora cactorum]|nr:hypothetical protein Pcac1_g20290 [Phytophthora cactorum]